MIPHQKLCLTLAIFLTVPGIAAAQCPDGSPPPCETRRTAPTASAPKRINPPLDEDTWIVLPFNNVTRAPDAEWLSDASVNMLSMDLSRWQDVHVIDDRRVADFMRELPKGAAARLSFNDGVAVARRAGAGKLVIGDVLKVGSRTTVTATVFTVRDGKQIRTAREEATVADSIMPLFGKLARGILAVPSADANVGSVGTSRADAYQEYVSGIKALNKFDAPAAKTHFEAALKLDTTFALAHYKWAIASTYDDKAGAARASQIKLTDVTNLLKLVEDTARIRHARAAARTSSNLPPRDRTLITGLVALVTYDLPRACDAYGSLVRADSSDVEALYGLGLCLASDDMVEAVGGDTTTLRFRSSWNSALKVFRRALAVDPTFHLAFDPVVSMLTASRRNGCRHAEVFETCADTVQMPRYSAALRRSGDSLVTTPQAMGPDATMLEQMVTANRSSPLRENIEAARVAAADWVEAGPTEGRAHKYLARLLLKLGRPGEAESQLHEAMLDPALKGDPEFWVQRLEIAAKLHRGRQVNQVLDSMKVLLPGDLGQAAFSTLAAMTGRVHASDSLYASILKAQHAPAPFAGILVVSPRIAVGAAGDTVAALERAIFALRKSGAVCDKGCLTLLGPGYTLGLGIARTWPRFTADAESERRMAPALALAKGDTVAFRAAAKMLDSVSKAAARALMPEDGSSVIAADAYLILRDTASALAAVRRMMDTTLMVTSVDGLLGIGAVGNALLWPRALMMRGDLEAATKDGKEAAVKAYDDFLDLWAYADPEFAPLLARIRTARNRLAK